MPCYNRNIAVVVLLLSVLSHAFASRLTGFRVSRMLHPVGIERTAQFSWQIESQEQNLTQTAYYIRVATTPEGLQGGRDMLWDSERVQSADCQMVPYQGRRFPYGSDVYWQVESWLSNGEHITSPIQKFQTGLKNTQWKAKWIETKAGDVGKSFSVTGSPTRAILYVASSAPGTCSINGKTATPDGIGNHSSERTLYYTVHDVTSLVHRGSNDLNIHSGEDVNELRAQLVVETPSDTSVIASGEDWEHTSLAPYPQAVLMPLPVGEGRGETLATFECSADSLNHLFLQSLEQEASDSLMGTFASYLQDEGGACHFLWLHTMEDLQTTEGFLPDGEAAVRTLYMLYRRYADRHALMTYYPMLARWASPLLTSGPLLTSPRGEGLQIREPQLISQLSEMAVAVGQRADLSVYETMAKLQPAASCSGSLAPSDSLQWLIEDIAGIRQADGSLAYKELDMQPLFPDSLSFAKASLRSPYGTILSHWTREDGDILWTVELPANTSARLHSPSGYEFTNISQLLTHGSIPSAVVLGSGTYNLVLRETKQD